MKEDYLMKKLFCLLLALGLLMGALSAFAGEGAITQKLIEQTAAFLDEQGIKYSFDSQYNTYEFDFALDSKLSKVNVAIWLYDDMVYVDADSPLRVEPEYRDAVAKFITLLNRDTFYCYFLLDYESGLLTCRSAQLIRDQLPGKGEMEDLLYSPLEFMEGYGDALLKISTQGANPDQVYQDLKQK